MLWRIFAILFTFIVLILVYYPFHFTSDRCWPVTRIVPLLSFLLSNSICKFYVTWSIVDVEDAKDGEMKCDEIGLLSLEYFYVAWNKTTLPYILDP